MWKKPEVIVGRMIEYATVNIESKDNVVEAHNKYTQLKVIWSQLTVVVIAFASFSVRMFSIPPFPKLAIPTGCYGALLDTI